MESGKFSRRPRHLFLKYLFDISRLIQKKRNKMHFAKDIYAIDNKLLMKAGKNVNEQTLYKIAKIDKNIHYIKLSNTAILKDIKRTLNDRRYKTVFSPKNINQKIIKLVKQISLPKKLVDELKKVKRELPYTYHHMLIITILSAKIALDKNMKDDYSPKTIIRLGLVHDIGKTRIPQKVLNKRTALTRMERKILKQHPSIGFLLLHYYYGRNHRKYDYASYEHHERLDGSGYPRKIHKINRHAQLIAVVDTLDALISSRPYRKIPYTLRGALDHIVDEAENGKLNKKIAYLLISYARKDKPKPNQLRISKEKRDKVPHGNVYKALSVR